jgi:endoglucanase
VYDGQRWLTKGDTMAKGSNDFLTRLLTAPSPSGFEQPAAKIWREEAGTFADEVTWDVAGNSYARLKGEGAPVVVIEGHIDEIGFIITHIDEQGFLWFDKIGGWDDQVVVGQRIRIVGANGEVVGVIGKKAAHLLKPEDRDRVTRVSDLWIDIGAENRDAALKRVQIGDPAVIDAAPVALTDDLWASRSMDNRVGAYVALEAARKLAVDRPALDVFAVAATQEEISFAGAIAVAHHLKPTLAIAIDVTHATDYPGADKKSDSDVKVSGGPVLTRGSSVNPRVFTGLRDTAAKLKMDVAVQAGARSTGTDADAMYRAGALVATGLVSIPNRYMHSPSEVVSLKDLDAASTLIAAYVRTVTAETDFRP